jgi:hypothetical protein
MIKNISLIFVFYCLFFQYTQAQIIQKVAVLNKTCYECLNKMKPAYEGKSNAGIPYKLYAIKEGRDWIFVVADTASIYTFKKLNKVDTLISNSSFFDVNMCKILQEKPQDFKLYEKPNKIGDLQLANYYKMKSKALTAIGNILKKDKTKQGDEYIKNAAEHNYFNYASFNQEEVLKKHPLALDFNRKDSLDTADGVSIMGDSYLMVAESEYGGH